MHLSAVRPRAALVHAAQFCTEENEMKIRFIGKGWALNAALLAGLVYSALSFTAGPAYAASCNCTEERQDAQIYCINNFGDQRLYDFICPIGSDYDFVCYADPLHRDRVQACD